MMIQTSEVRNGIHDGKIVWICHYSQPDINKKPLRNISPIQCIIKPGTEYPKNKKLYYSKSFFQPYVNGKLKKKYISPVDNTGYRSDPGNEVYVFDNKEECIKTFNDQVRAVLPLIKSRQDDLEEQRSKLLDLIVEE